MAHTKTFKKVSETVFHLDETKDYSNDYDWIQVLSNLTQWVNEIKQQIAVAQKTKSQVNKLITLYNGWVDLLEEAKDKVKLAIKIPARLDFWDDYDVAAIDISKLPVIDIKLDTPVEPTLDVAQEKTEK